jgi:hypothetical protein
MPKPMENMNTGAASRPPANSIILRRKLSGRVASISTTLMY